MRCWNARITHRPTFNELIEECVNTGKIIMKINLKIIMKLQFSRRISKTQTTTDHSKESNSSTSNPDKPTFYALAATIDATRFPASVELWKEYFKLELSYFNMMKAIRAIISLDQQRRDRDGT
ncbi:hypothetical protein Glove_139g34 [Diversispora epigaea]|uniref:Uncharacterized protein n=1 Tax=Diversispora epigaea TaxID=1348612 RepID=A0A397J4S1_9GLOM|nr:hypothetical protein Glove_139g34 [Diversispora epigaea]